MHSSSQSWLWGRQHIGLLDCIGSPKEMFQRQRSPWECAVCSARFKWDVQLLRHERATGHQNPNREMRRQQRYKKIPSKVIKCTLCDLQFAQPLERLQHKRWCPNDPQTQKNRDFYRSSFQRYPYQCCLHQVPHYYSDLILLKSHIKTHNKIGEEQIQQLTKIFRWKKKWKHTGLTNEQYRSILEKLGLKASFTTLRRIFKKV